MGKADVILGIKITHGEQGLFISQSHYIEKVLEKFNFKDCSPVKTPFDPSAKLVPNNGVVVNQLEYSKVIGSLMLFGCKLDYQYGRSFFHKWLSIPSWRRCYMLGIKETNLYHKFNNGIGVCGISSSWCKNKGTTYISMKISRFKKLGLGFDVFMKDKDIG
ncbi:uncharacterized protein LOC121784286 [Salvia splendens]|uniref:uncharacterized protein LOC121784286 n=1 Tax=Salvia splendens TaxID=180675 RepID=UPI001C27BBD2|nr:uncharacterized protein LOC121784286 [Salvia splendens]